MNWKSDQVFIPDLSHYEWPADLNALADAGCVGVIWKATQGTGYQDPTCSAARAAAYAAGLLWGIYHFAEASNVEKQANNFLSFMPTSDDLICLDFEDNGNNSMSLADAQAWIQRVEDNLGRANECVLYSGNRIKETLGDKPSAFWSARRLWIAQYSSSGPDLPAAWASYWLWQFSDGSSGPTPHNAAGCGACDMNAYDSSEAQLKAEWASGKAQPTPPEPPSPPPSQLVTITIDAPPGVSVNVIQNTP